eukprot:GILI01003044.1.p1 GENE.GILI01003044.1~~GILI01003044.1.p1  ORF type:complete len:1825 (-),score=764.15 GILI01003044.1:251-5320(-)
MSIKLWDWDKNWTCSQIYEGHTHYVMMVAFNPKDWNTFASASLDRSIKVWGVTGGNSPHFTLEGHDRGVNCIDYFPHGDKPYLVSGADDKTVKVWDYQTKQCIQTLEGHTNNISSVVFHPELPILLSGSEDGTVRIWHANTYRLETTVSYNMERLWSISVLRGSHSVALGYDDGTIVIKMGNEDPVASMNNGKLIWAKHSEIQTANLKLTAEAGAAGAAEETESTGAVQVNLADGERLSLVPKDMGSCDIFPQALRHSPNGRLFAVCGDGEYIIFTAQALRNKSFGPALEFAWARDGGDYAIRESPSKIKVFKNFKEHRSFKPSFQAEGLFGGVLVCVRSEDFVCFYDWDECRLIRRIDVVPRVIEWSDSGELAALVCEEALYLLRFSKSNVQAALDSGRPLPEDGIEEAFDLLHEISDKISTCLWVGDCFVYTTPAGKLNYCVGGEVFTLAHLDRPMSLLGYIPQHNRVYLIDKEFNVVSYQLLLAVVEYQTAIVRKDFEAANRLFPAIPVEHRSRVARFLEAQGYREEALAVSEDPEHKFELALQLNKLEMAYELALQADKQDQQSGSEHKWKQLGDIALSAGLIALAEDCFTRAKDLGGLLLLHSSTGNAEGMRQLAVLADQTGRTNISFVAYFLLQQLEDCLEVLLRAGRVPEAAFLARTYLPSQVSRVLALWKEDLGKVSKRAAQSLADPTSYPSLFPDLALALRAETRFKAARASPLPASEYLNAKPLLDMDAIAEIKERIAAGLPDVDTPAPVSAPTPAPAPAPAPVDKKETVENLKKQKNELEARLKALDERIARVNAAPVDQPSNTKFRSVAEIDEEIRMIEEDIQHSSLTLAEEKKLVAEIGRLRKDKTIFDGFLRHKNNIQLLQDEKSDLLKRVRAIRNTINDLSADIRLSEYAGRIAGKKTGEEEKDSADGKKKPSKASQVDVSQLHHELLDVSESTMGVLSGRGILRVRKLENDFEIIVELDRRKSQLKLVGLAADVARAIETINSQEYFNFESQVTIDVDPKTIPAVVGKGGANIQGLETTHNVLIALAKDEPKLTIYGTEANVKKGKAAIEKLVNESVIVNEQMDIPREEVLRALREHGGERVKKIETGSGAFISIDMANKNLKLRGSKVAVKKAQELVMSFMANFEAVTIAIPAERVGFVMGKAGSRINDIRNQHDVNLHRLDDGIQLLGEHAKVFKAKTAIEALITGLVGEPLVVPINPQDIGAVLGKGGSVLRQIETDSGAAIELDKEANELRIRGLEADKKKAAKLIKDHLEAESHREEIEVPADIMPALIGKGGANIRSFEQEGKVLLDVERKEGKVKLRGSKTAVVATKAKIELFIKEHTPITHEFKSTPQQVMQFGSDYLDNLRWMRDEMGTVGYGAEIHLNRKAGVISVKGTKPMIEKAKQVMRQFNSGTVYAVFSLIPAHYESLKNQRQQRYDAEVEFKDEAKFVGIKGSLENVHKTKVALEKTIGFFFPTQISLVDIPAGLFSVVNSTKGRAIVTKFKPRHTVVEADRVRNVFVIRGEEANVAEAKAEVNALFEEVLAQRQKEKEAEEEAERAEGIVKVEIPIKSHHIPRIIGSRGANISRLREETGVKSIDIVDDAMVVIKGKEEEVNAAKEEISEIIENTPEPREAAAPVASSGPAAASGPSHRVPYTPYTAKADDFPTLGNGVVPARAPRAWGDRMVDGEH